MSTQELLAAVNSPRLREFISVWAGLRRDRRMPAWSDVRPAQFKGVLSIIWAWTYDAAAEDFVGRIAGEQINAVFGMNIRGQTMSKVYSGHDYVHMLARHRRVMSEPALFGGTGLVFRHLDRFDVGERVILPLGNDGANGDTILGATDFKSDFGSPPEALLSGGETEAWFALD